jgi:transposase
MLGGMWASSTALAITAEDKAELERLVRSGRTEQRHALRARIILGAAEGRSNNALAKELKTSRPTIVDWRARYVEGGVKALYEDRPRDEDRRRGKSFEAVARSKEAEIVAKTQSPPANATHWSCRRMAETCPCGEQCPNFRPRLAHLAGLGAGLFLRQRAETGEFLLIW